MKLKLIVNMIHQSFSFIIVLVVALIPAALVRGCTNHHGDRGECLSPLECEVTGGIRIGTFERCISAGGRDRRRVCCKRLPCSGINTNDIEEFIMVSVRCSSCYTQFFLKSAFLSSRRQNMISSFLSVRPPPLPPTRRARPSALGNSRVWAPPLRPRPPPGRRLWPQLLGTEPPDGNGRAGPSHKGIARGGKDTSVQS